MQEGESVKAVPREHPPSPVPNADRPDGEIHGRWPWVERAVWTERMLEALERGPRNGVWHSLIDKVWAPKTLQLAWAKVAANAGAAGVDRVSVGMFAKMADQQLAKLSRELREGSYRPQPVRRVWIPKPGSAQKRPLGIPAVCDRIVQTALRMVLEPIFERDFARESFGLRPARGCQQAIDRVEQLLAEGYHHIVDADIKSYFDMIPQRALLERVRAKIADGRILALVEAFLKQGVLEELKGWSPTERGTPQGAVISPLLANIYLDALDWKLHLEGWELVRYADDFVVLCRTGEQAQEVLQAISAWCETAGLQLHPEKTRLVDMGRAGGFDFLGYHFEITGACWPRKKSLQQMKRKLHQMTPRKNGQSLTEIIREQLNPSLKGWYIYFRRSNRWTFSGLDAYVRGRLRGILRKRHGGRGRGRGSDHQRWSNRYFEELGLLSLERLWHLEHPVPSRGNH
jgi:RNA-directed DNA polymerase